jgi:hypothetical protein
VQGEQLGDEGLYAAEGGGGGERGALVGSLFCGGAHRVRCICDVLVKRSLH